MTTNPTRSRKASEILANAPRCIYCSGLATSVEHMPSRAMFKEKQRPSGLEFPSCIDCNTGTAPADAFVAFLARIDRGGQDTDHWHVQEALKYLKAAGSAVPGLKSEMFDDDRAKDVLFRTSGGLLIPLVETEVGPLGRALLNVWTAKLGMALYHEHTGKPLPSDGGVQAMWFLNAGLSQATADGFLAILPGYGTLKQGERKSASGQFDYRFNSDNKSIVAALTHFHSNIHFFTIATSDPATYGFPSGRLPHSRFVRPGELLALMPKGNRFRLRPLNLDLSRASNKGSNK